MLVLLVSSLPPALAATTKNRDRTDNSFSFTYDAEQRRMLRAESSIRYDFDDDVEFTVTVKELEGQEPPLLGRIWFRLLVKKPVAYQGQVRFRVIDAPGDVTFEATREVSFVLKPEEGQRTHRMRFPFEVPTGDYTVTVKFTS